LKTVAQVSAARKAAFKILLVLEGGQAHSDDLLRGRAVSALGSLDRNLATTLVLGVLRWQLELDERVRPLLKHPNAKLDPEVRIALRLGAFQLLHLDRIPARAAIDESVELTKQSGHRFASAMVNAVLRKLAAEPKETVASDANVPREMLAYPQWMRDRWETFFGADAARTICLHGQSQPMLALRITDPAVEEELAQAGIHLSPGSLITQARIVVSGDITATEAFREGRVRIQDEGSQLVAEIAGQGSQILDCCAAPGGKTMILAERNPHARIVACESSPQRLELLRKRLLPLAYRIECRLADVTALSEEAIYDLVLADVPCSGTGTLGRNPEIRHRLKIEEFARQADHQAAILDRALHAARPQGRVVYSTCSLEIEENEQVVSAALHRHSKTRIIPIVPRLQKMCTEGILAVEAVDKLQTCLTPEGYLRLFPGAFGTDGFFVAMFEDAP
jgi:16S rRNA (cytosine967-C5)-methyltransferase